ncbi:hypothetical protein ACFP51_21760 [Streptomyces pratens]|uniref:DUF3558 domain-containing protein n=1 Tax=Streptomyces pratens TaxID=887456 RepID=A0ABW1LWY8_9ACTN
MTKHIPPPQRRLHRPSGRALGTGALAAVLTLTSAGCSGPDRDYSMPGDLCGVTVDSDLISPFLPGGKKLTQDSYDHGVVSPRCRVIVDRSLIMHISGDVVPPEIDPIQVKDRGLLRLGTPSPVDVGDAARIADHGAMAVADCTRDGEPMRFVTMIELQKEIPEETPKRRSDLTQLLRAYFPKAMAAVDCTKA